MASALPTEQAASSSEPDWGLGEAVQVDPVFTERTGPKGASGNSSIDFLMGDTSKYTMCPDDKGLLAATYENVCKYIDKGNADSTLKGEGYAWKH